MDLDSLKVLKEHSSIILQKKQLNILYKAFYKELLSGFSSRQKIIELGSGGGFIKQLRADIVTSDVLKAPEVDVVFQAEEIPFKDQSVDGFVMLNVFHHIKDPENALREMSRVLKMNGKIVMIEPWNSPFSRFVYTHFHHEVFNPQSKSWKIQGKKRMTDANGANPWIIFVRDRTLFCSLFPELTIRVVRPHTPFSYLLSGGLSRPAMIMSSLMPVLIKVEEKLSKYLPFLSMFVTISIQKNKK